MKNKVHFFHLLHILSMYEKPVWRSHHCESRLPGRNCIFQWCLPNAGEFCNSEVSLVHSCSKRMSLAAFSSSRRIMLPGPLLGEWGAAKSIHNEKGKQPSFLDLTDGAWTSMHGVRKCTLQPVNFILGKIRYRHTQVHQHTAHFSVA